ncbi:relaxase/mobilization nuclease domain-containing protein [Kineococcus glutinatus]|uniref:MobA/VirD2-like nuclease domain-containing protein n=1 Tax=Kineococcus glutinatus TaxID=1070872 RepID=A0ABP9HJY4_9ACTN
MIGKVSRGNDTAGLLRYLFGPGRANEHTDPHLVAAWDTTDQHNFQALQPAHDGHRHDVRPLARLLDQPLAALPRQPTTTVWHCSLRTAPGDKVLSDEQWADAARTVLDRVGLAPAGDLDGCRWVAVRHADDHIHLLVTLARQDGKNVRTSHDYRRVGEACRDLEHRHGLQSTPVRDGTAIRRPTRAETEKATRHGLKESSRETLRREVRLAAAATDSTDAFLADLGTRGLLIKLRYSTHDPGQVTGYAVAWPGDRSQDGGPVWFSGSRLADDLSLPRLARQWASLRDDRCAAPETRPGPGHGSSAPQREHTGADIARAVRLTSRLLQTASSSSDEVDAVARAAVALLMAIARSVEGSRGGVLTSAADAYDSALGRARGHRAPTPPAAVPLLQVAQHVAAIGRLSPSQGSSAWSATAELFHSIQRLRGPDQPRVVERVVMVSSSHMVSRPQSALPEHVGVVVEGQHRGR